MPMTQDKEYADRVKQLARLINKAADNCRERGMAVSFTVDTQDKKMIVECHIHKPM